MARNAMLEIEVLLANLRDDIEASYKAKGLMASGNFAKELKLVVSGNNARITAPRYVGAMEGGRIADKRPPLWIIRKWIEDKNKQGASIPLTAAYPIAKAIGEFGIKVPNSHNPGGVVSDVLNPARVLKLQNEIITIIKYAIIDTLNIK
uniref:Uncharacterized protein n=1 Tax=Siphoviridae sp. cttOT32 TaxID=2826493 RepID=A0A8S5QMZ3_9CAUD|nr:MAG TPA: hypothetical protein [Siphoviridae sp. cttOT32]